MEKNFKFWLPADIEKSSNTVTGKEEWKFKGIASTSDKDTDGEVLLPQGFDLSYFTSAGFVNWNHQSKGNPSMVIGEPTVAKIVPEGLYVETKLYNDSPTAKSVWDLANILKNSNSNRRLGFSIEGKVMEKDPFDEKKITKAKITGLAITPSPKNKSTFADICKGEGSLVGDSEFDWEYDIFKSNDLELILKEEFGGETAYIDSNFKINIEKSQASENANNEYFEKNNIKNLDNQNNTHNLKSTLTKSEVFERIFVECTSDIEKAERIFELVKLVENMSTVEKLKNISTESIDKAFEILKSQKNDIEKGEVSTKLVDGESTIAGSANGFTVDVVMGMYKAMDAKSKDEYIAKAIEKGASEEMAKSAYDKAIEKGFLPKDSKESDKKDKDKKDDDDSDDLKKAEEDLLNAQKRVEDLKNKQINSEQPIIKFDDSNIVKAMEETNSLIKSLVANNNNMNEVIKSQNNEIGELKKSLDIQEKKIEEFLNTPIGKRTVQVSGYLQKSTEEEIKKSAAEEGKKVLDLRKSNDSGTFMKMLDNKFTTASRKSQSNVEDDLAKSEASFYGNTLQKMELGREIASDYLKNSGAASRIEEELNIRLVY